MSKRQEQAKATEEKIKQTTMQLLANHNFNDLSVEDITNASGVAKGTFYRYFKKKEDIVLALGLESFYELESDTTRLATENVETKLRYYFVNFMLVIEKSGIELARQWVKNVVDPSKTASDFIKWDFDVESITKILNQGIKDDRLKSDTPVDVLARILGTELYGMVSVWCMTDSKFTPSDWTVKFCDVQLPALLAPYLISSES